MSRQISASPSRGVLLLAAVLACTPVRPAFATGQAPGRAAIGAKPVGAKPVGAIALASHRAVYELKLMKSTGTKSPTSAQGRIAFDFTGSPCEGYAQSFRQLTELQPAEGPVRVSDMYSATFEDAEGRSYDFRMQTKIDDSAAEAIDGKAVRSPQGALAVELYKPKANRFKLVTGVIFPTEHLRRILAAAQAGQNVLEVKVYDGSETGEKVFDTTTIIGHAIREPAVEEAARIPELAKLRRWPVSIAYFEAGRGDRGPSYTLSFDLYENGISRALKLDYGDFILAGEMSSLELLAEPACRR
jgi:hypothetical protein